MAQVLAHPIRVVKEGELLKRGEIIKTWRPRYFVLKSDGSLRGYKDGPPKAGESPLNFFDISGSIVEPYEDVKSKRRGFIIRFMQLTTFVERIFLTEHSPDANEWIRNIVEVKRTVSAQAPSPAARPVTGEKGPSLSLDDYEIRRVLGKGTFGKVLLARDKKTDALVAIKILKKDVILAKDELVHTMTENEVLQTTRHPFLTCLHASFQTADLLCFVMEYVNGGELFYHLSREKRFSEERARFYACEVLLALSYLHERNIIYRDLKLENLLLDRAGHVKMTDFGLCKGDMGSSDRTATFCGTPEYLAPEVLQDSDYGRAVDWWALGIITYEMVCGKLPFYDRSHDILFEKILTAEVEYPALLSDKARDLVQALLQKDPLFRLGGGEGDGKEVMSHPFFASVDFDAMLRLQLKPPFVPRIEEDDGISNFDPLFTNQSARLTPPSGGLGDGERAERDVAFKDFAFTTAEPAAAAGTQ